VGEVALRHEIVCLKHILDVTTMNTQSHPHDHVLRSFDNLSVDAEEVRSLESFETEVVVCEVPVIDDGRVEHVLVLHDDLVDIIGDHRCVLAGLRVDPVVEIGDDSRERLLRLFVKVGNGDTGGKDSIIGVLCREVCSSLGGEVV